MGSDALLEPYEASIKLLDEMSEAVRKLLERRVFVLGSRLTTPIASSSMRRPLAAESSSESLAVASVIAGGVEGKEGVWWPWRGGSCHVEGKKLGSVLHVRTKRRTVEGLGPPAMHPLREVFE